MEEGVRGSFRERMRESERGGVIEGVKSLRSGHYNMNLSPQNNFGESHS